MHGLIKFILKYVRTYNSLSLPLTLSQGIVLRTGNSAPSISRLQRGSQTHVEIKMEWPRGLTCAKAGGGCTLCTLHQA